MELGKTYIANISSVEELRNRVNEAKKKNTSLSLRFEVVEDDAVVKFDGIRLEDKDERDAGDTIDKSTFNLPTKSTWQSDEGPVRFKMVEKIIAILQRRKPGASEEWLKKVRKVGTENVRIRRCF